jgi:hypothetical protein
MRQRRGRGRVSRHSERASERRTPASAFAHGPTRSVTDASGIANADRRSHGGRHRRRRLDDDGEQLRPGRLHDPAGPGIPQLPVHRLGLPRGVDRARPQASRGRRVTDRASFEVATAASFSGTCYDLAATFDCLHDMGDPLAAARHIRQALKSDGTWLVVEPAAAGNLVYEVRP